MVGVNNTQIPFNSFLKSAENIVTHFDDNKDERNKTLNDLQDIIRHSCTHDVKVKKVFDTIKELTKDDEKDPDEILLAFRGKKQELLDYIPDVSNHSNLKDYCSQVKELIDNADGNGRPQLDDDDIEMTQDDINVIDPFTKRRMTDPMKNKVCGHVYDRESVISVLKMNKNTRCPVVGCINKNPVLVENLISDIITRKYLHDNPEHK